MHEQQSQMMRLIGLGLREQTRIRLQPTLVDAASTESSTGVSACERPDADEGEEDMFQFRADVLLCDAGLPPSRSNSTDRAPPAAKMAPRKRIATKRHESRAPPQ